MAVSQSDTDAAPNTSAVETATSEAVRESGLRRLGRRVRLAAHHFVHEPPRFWYEFVAVVVGIAVYFTLQHKTPYQVAAAMDRGQSILDFEDRLHIALERPLNSFLGRVDWLAVATNYYYVLLHFSVPIAMMIWLYFRRRDSYRNERRVLVWVTSVSLACFWAIPTAPPRLLPGAGFIDTLALHNSIGAYDSGPYESAADQFGAMPSMHVAFALWAGIAMFRYAKHRWVGRAWLLHPVFMTWAVLSTGNHYLLDVIAGAGVLVTAILLSAVTVAACQRSGLMRRCHLCEEPDPDLATDLARPRTPR